MHHLRGPGADHVFNGGKRTEPLPKQVMPSAVKQTEIGFGYLDASSLTWSYELYKG